MINNITVSETIVIKTSPSELWDFTQDFTKRTSWDTGIRKVEVLQKRPFKRIRINSLGMWAILTYKLCRKPFKTSLKLEETKSLFIVGGGGSWRYKDLGNQTEWTQTNTLVLKNRLLYITLAKVFKGLLKYNTKKSMARVKNLIEKK